MKGVTIFEFSKVGKLSVRDYTFLNFNRTILCNSKFLKKNSQEGKVLVKIIFSEGSKGKKRMKLAPDEEPPPKGTPDRCGCRERWG